MKHKKHLFKNIGGGCGFGIDKYPCDDHYKCECGAEFKLLTSQTGHFYLPESFYSEEPSEIKAKEIELITEVTLENLKIDDNKPQ